MHAERNCHLLTLVVTLILALFITITAEYMDALSAAELSAGPVHERLKRQFLPKRGEDD